MSLFLLIMLFGAYALVDGVSRLINSVWHRDAYRHWWLVFLWGLIGLAGGVVVFSWPGLSAVMLHSLLRLVHWSEVSLNYLRRFGSGKRLKVNG